MMMMHRSSFLFLTTLLCASPTFALSLKPFHRQPDIGYRSTNNNNNAAIGVGNKVATTTSFSKSPFGNNKASTTIKKATSDAIAAAAEGDDNAINSGIGTATIPNE